MCRISHRDNPAGDWCTELGKVWSKNWDTQCPLRPPEEFNFQEKVSEFIETIQSFCKGKATIEDVINKAQHDELRKWYVQHGQVAGDNRAKIIAQKAPPVIISAPIVIDKNCRINKKSKKDEELLQRILDRDHYHCRYCGNKLIDLVVWEKLEERAKSDQFKQLRHELIQKKPNGSTIAGNEDVPGLFFFTSPTVDHVNPCNNGGKKTEDNLVSSCYACNFGKGKFTCEQIGINNPFDSQPKPSDWDGLKSLIPILELMI